MPQYKPHAWVHPDWLYQEVDHLLLDLMERCGISLYGLQEPAPVDPDSVFLYTEIDGSYYAAISLWASRSMLLHLAEHMLMAPPILSDDPEECGREFFNIFCGRLVSDIHRLTGTPARFYSPNYQKGPVASPQGNHLLTSRLFYQDSDGHSALFAWTSNNQLPTLQKHEGSNDTKMNYRLMVVDDSRIAFAEMKKLLDGTDLEIVQYCRSGEEALSHYEEVAPDLVTMDIVMPGMDGLDTSRELLRRWPDARILVVSSLAYDDTIEMSSQIGAKGFLFKPFDRDTLIEALRKTLA